MLTRRKRMSRSQTEPRAPFDGGHNCGIGARRLQDFVGAAQLGALGAWPPPVDSGLPQYPARFAVSRTLMLHKRVSQGSGAATCARMSLMRLSHLIRDLHSTRTADIPPVGSLLCTERTSQHESLLLEVREVASWSTPEECAEEWLELPRDGDMRDRIAQAGLVGCIENGVLNQVVMTRVLDVQLLDLGLVR